MHDCIVDNNHRPYWPANQEYVEAVSAIRAGYCPICLHDFALGLVCIECGHYFTCAPFGVIAVDAMPDVGASDGVRLLVNG